MKTRHQTHRKKGFFRQHVKSIITIIASVVFILIGFSALWLSTLPIPDLDSFHNRKMVQSTKIYDRTGNVLLYDTGADIKRKVVPLGEISPFIQKAAIAIEDSDFYTNIGIEPLSIIRALIADIATGSFHQGGSTITQQVIKNSLLTQDKTITRKLKELVLAVKLTKIMSKDDILETYLNETPYGGTVYGVEEASQRFFGKPASSVTLTEAAYLAAIPQAPTYYSPYGNHREDLDKRKNLVLQRMLKVGFISQQEHDLAVKEEVNFLSSGIGGIKAPHFVMMVRDQITERFGEEAVLSGGMRVITTLDFSIQSMAEESVASFAPSMLENFHASNTAIVAIDPQNGDVLALVGSKDYFDKAIDGNFNITTALRQPGSTFKPFVYATAFSKGYTPETILFDVPTEFSILCNPDGTPKNPSTNPDDICYSPTEFDELFPGPMTIRTALAQSRNIPAVKALYLSGLYDSIRTAKSMGITSLNDPARYGLTLVLGGGEVSLLELTSAYGVFANDGVRNPYRLILEVYDSNGDLLEKSTPSANQAIPPESARQISSILSDNNVRMNSLRPIADSVGTQVAIKTGTTNDFRDVWTVGYTPNLVVGAWAGKNDNSPLEHNVAGLIISPLWGSFMSKTASTRPKETFIPAPDPLTDNKPVLRGVWQGGASYWKDRISGKVATDLTPPETREEVIFNQVHNILHWINKSNPRGVGPLDPKTDPQYEYWEYGVRKWFEQYQATNPTFKEVNIFEIPKATDDIHVPSKFPIISISNPNPNSIISPQSLLTTTINYSGVFPVQKTEVYLNDKYVMTTSQNPLQFSFVPQDIGNLSERNTLSVVVYDSVFNRATSTTEFLISSFQ